MKRVSALLLTILYFTQLHAAVGDSTKHFAVLELYTSEGCSSCPPAEDLVPELGKKFGDKIFILQFHVDYWNRLGWEDQYSKAEYSDRQRDYTRVFNTSNVYTPQAIVNGRTHLSGADRGRLLNLLNIETATKRQVQHLGLIAEKAGENKVKVTFSTTLTDNEQLHIALVQKKAYSQVHGGENKGKLLWHYNVVRELSTAFYEEGEKEFEIPRDLYTKDCYIIAIVQDNMSMHITNAAKVNIE